MDALVTFDDGDKIKMNIWANGGGAKVSFWNKWRENS